MRSIERDIGRILALLRSRIRERGFTQLEGLITVLTQKNLITAHELDDATKRFRQDAP